MIKYYITSKVFTDEKTVNNGVTNHSDGNTYECDICKDNGKCDNTDIFQCYNYYLELNPSRNKEIEIWDVEKRIWIKRGY